MARRRTPTKQRDPNIVVEGPGRAANGRRPAKKKGPPFIIIGAIVLAVILMTVPFIAMMGGEEKKPGPPPPPVEDKRYNPLAPEYVAKQPKQWGPVKAGMTQQQVEALNLNNVFSGKRPSVEALKLYTGKTYEKWTYVVDSGRGGIFHGQQGRQLMVIFQKPPGIVMYVRPPTQAEMENGKVTNRVMTYEELVQRAREAGEL